MTINNFERQFLAVAFAVLITVIGATTVINAQETQVEPGAVIDELKEKLGNATEEQVNEIVEKWNAREDLAGKSKNEMMLLLFQDVASVITDVEAQKKINMSWQYEPNVNPFEEQPGCDYKVASGQPDACPAYLRMISMQINGAKCFNYRSASIFLDGEVCSQPALLPGSAAPVACVEPVSLDVTRSAGFFSFYCRTTNPEYQELQKDLQKEKVLESLAADLNKVFKMPYPIGIGFQQCKRANAFYLPGDGMVVMCYELIDKFEETFEEAGYQGEELDEAVANAVTFAIHHELGHALTDTLNLPVEGSEEDFADQLATFVVADGDDDDELVAFDGATAFLLMAKDTDARQTEFWSEHSLGTQRFTNIMCWLYADSPNKYPNAISDGLLPQSRANGCGKEWQAITENWSNLLEPHLK